MQAMLGRLLQYFLDSDDLDPDLNDRTMMYYRMLSTNPEKCKKVVTPVRDTVETFTEEREDDVKDRIFKQFNTLSVVFGLPQNAFIDDEYATVLRDDLDVDEDAGGMLGDDNGDQSEPMQQQQQPMPLHPVVLASNVWQYARFGSHAQDSQYIQLQVHKH